MTVMWSLVGVQVKVRVRERSNDSQVNVKIAKSLTLVEATLVFMLRIYEFL